MRRRFSPLDFWRGLLDSLDTGGGHIFVAMCVLGVGVWAYKYMDSTAGGQVMTGALTALWVMLKSQKSNREQMSASASVTTQTTATDPPPPLVTPPPQPAPITEDPDA